MNELFQLGSAVFNYLSTAGTVNFYYAKAPQGSTPPYGIIQLMSAVDEYTFNDKGIKSDYAIKIISNRNFPSEAITIYSSVHELIQDANLTYTGYDSLRVQRQSLMQFEDNKGFWHVGGIYQIEIWES